MNQAGRVLGRIRPGIRMSLSERGVKDAADGMESDVVFAQGEEGDGTATMGRRMRLVGGVK